MPEFKHWIRTQLSEDSGPAFMAGSKNKHDTIIYVTLTVVSSLMLLFLLVMAYLRIYTKNADVLYLSIVSLSVISVMGIVALRTYLPFFAPTLIPITLLALNTVIFLRLGFDDGFSGTWIFVVIPMAYFTVGRKLGFIFSFSVLAASMFFLFFPRFSAYTYSGKKIIRIITVYILLFVMTYIYGLIRFLREKRLQKLNSQLKEEHDEFMIMKDSLKTSLFLMDRDLIIQNHYSRLLEETLGVTNLSGRKFTDLLASSLTSAEISTVSDFFDMVFERRFEADMLDDINPLNELKYIRNGGGFVKILHCTFTPIDRTSGETVIMCNIEDITAKVELQKQIQREEVKHQEEMNTLFEVLQIDPGVFDDFIEDTEYEFDSINDILKNSRVSSKDTLVTIFQSIHAIKANAIILGLNNYSQKLHAIESYIKELQTKAEVGFDDMLCLTVRIESVMEDKDNFRRSVEKIKSFSTGGMKKGIADILTENLSRAVERTSGSIGKKVRMDATGVDAATLENAPRRLIKEVLLQLVRNSVFHGIESPDKRLERGKNESGLITVSINTENERIHIRLQDDGEGLDFEKIKQRAEQMHLIRKNEKIEDKNRIYQAIFMPGFSTARSESMYAGRGMGLDLVRSRIREHNGTIKIQTEAGKGSVFHIFLPLQNTEEDIKE
jgi:two-component system chemotaxis sensor kinase CheA